MIQSDRKIKTQTKLSKEEKGEGRRGGGEWKGGNAKQNKSRWGIFGLTIGCDGHYTEIDQESKGGCHGVLLLPIKNKINSTWLSSFLPKILRHYLCLDLMVHSFKNAKVSY